MYQEKYNLTWDSYSNHLRKMLQEMMKSSYLTDVTLICDDKKQFKAHKIVLSACSSALKIIIDDLPEYNSVIYLRGIQHQEMESILEFIYLGSTTLYQERMKEFLEVSKSLEISEISKFFENDTTEETVVEEVSDEVTFCDSDGNQQTPVSVPKTKECPECNKTFKTPSVMRRHYDALHKGVLFPCNLCEYKGTQKTHLKNHIKAKHSVGNDTNIKKGLTLYSL